MLITLFTDVSYDPRSCIGAYAWWAKLDGVTYRGSGVFREVIENSNIAEVCGLINGVYSAIEAIRPSAGTKFLAQTDSALAIAVLAGRGPKHGHLRRIMQDKISKHQLQIEYRHVKAHEGNVTRRNAVNSWCDRTARALMRSHRDRAQESTDTP